MYNQTYTNLEIKYVNSFNHICLPKKNGDDKLFGFDLLAACYFQWNSNSVQEQNMHFDVRY